MTQMWHYLKFSRIRRIVRVISNFIRLFSRAILLFFLNNLSYMLINEYFLSYKLIWNDYHFRIHLFQNLLRTFWNLSKSTVMTIWHSQNELKFSHTFLLNSDKRLSFPTENAENLSIGPVHRNIWRVQICVGNVYHIYKHTWVQNKTCTPYEIRPKSDLVHSRMYVILHIFAA